MSETTPERLLDKLCADMNEGLFTPEAWRDFYSLRDLYSSCGITLGEVNRLVKKEKISRIYLTLVNVIKYDFTDIDRITLAEVIAGYSRLGEPGKRSLALAAAKYYDRMTANELIRIAKKMLSEPVDERLEARRNTALNAVKTISRQITFGKYDKNLV